MGCWAAFLVLALAIPPSNDANANLPPWALPAVPLFFVGFFAVTIAGYQIQEQITGRRPRMFSPGDSFRMQLRLIAPSTIAAAVRRVGLKSSIAICSAYSLLLAGLIVFVSKVPW